MTAEEHIARLEELSYFQEKLLTQLNEALTIQQKQLDSMEKRLNDMEESLSVLLDNLERHTTVNTLPPHFMPERY